MNELLDLYLTFARIGGLTFGGGIAMLPMLEKEVVDKKKWTTKDQILDYFAIGQCTPGIIAVNVATFIGYDRKGLAGGIIATLGVISPSILIILLIAFLLEPYMSLPLVQSAFAGIRVGVAVIILNAIINLWKSGVKNIFGVCLCLASFVCVGILNISPVYVVIVAICIGIIKTITNKGGAA